MAEVALFVGPAGRPDASYQDGDILHYMTQRRIRHLHARRICDAVREGFNSDGLRRGNGLARKFYQRVFEYRFDRVSATEVKRTTLRTGDEEILGPTPNAKGEYIDVELYLARRKAHARHKIFGRPGAEFWFGGDSDVDNPNLNRVWAMIEGETTEREVNYTRWPWTPTELRHFLVLSVPDVTERKRVRMEGGEIDVDEEQPDFEPKRQHNPRGGRLMRKRRFMLRWTEITGVNVARVRDRSRIVDVRDDVDMGRWRDNLGVKARLNIWGRREHLARDGEFV